MDKHQLIGMMLISMMLITYTQFYAPKPPEQAVQAAHATAAGVAPALHPTQEPHLTMAPIPEQGGGFAVAMQGTEREVVVENDVLKVTLTSHGGRIKAVVLKNYKDHKGEPLTLLDGQSSVMGFQFTAQAIPLNTSAFFFDTAEQGIEDGGARTITFTLAVGPGQYIRQVFSLPKRGIHLRTGGRWWG
jgi:YidC/Oxa1 family membrane protein insertase